MAEKTVLDALNESLAANGVPDPSASTEIEETEEELEVEETEVEETEEELEVEETEEEETVEEGEEEEEAEEGEETEEGEEAEEIVETPEQKAAREKAEKATPPDHLNDPIPEEKTRTNDRMRWLANEVKTLQPRAAQGDELIGFINQSGMSADEFSMALTFGRLKHSDNVEDHRKAFAILWDGLKELAPLIGETLPGVDPLEGHADLQARVTAKTLDPKDAAEMAAGRNRRKADAAAATRANQSRADANSRAAQNVELEKRVTGELNELGRELLKSDKHFEAKMAALSKETLKKIALSPPGLRVNAFLKAYLAIKLPTASAAAGKVVRKVGHQPLRGKTPASGAAGVKREPKTAVEALNFALDGR